MEISASESPRLPPGSMRKTAGADTGGAPSSVVESGATSVGSASPGLSLRLSELKDRLLAEPAVDTARVAEVARKVNTGGYQADSQQVASRLLEQEFALR